MANRNPYHENGASPVNVPIRPAAPQQDREIRTYFCRECQRQESGAYVPEGWYTINRATPSTRHPQFHQTRLGYFCSAVCMRNHLDRLHSIETKRDQDPAGMPVVQS